MQTDNNVDKKETKLIFYHPTYISFGLEKCSNCKKEILPYSHIQTVVNCVRLGMFCNDACLIKFTKNELDRINKEIALHESTPGPIMETDMFGNEIQETKESYMSGICLETDRDYKDTLEKVLKTMGEQ